MDIKKICKIADSSSKVTLLSPDGTTRIIIDTDYDAPNPAETTYFGDVSLIWSGVFSSDRVSPDACILDENLSSVPSMGDHIDDYAKKAVQYYAEPDEIIAYFTSGSGSLLLYANENGTYSFDGEDYEYDTDEVLDELFDAMTFEDAMGILDTFVYNLEYGDTNLSQSDVIRYFAYSANGGVNVEEVRETLFAYLSGDCYMYHEEYLIDPETDEWDEDEPWEVVYGYDLVRDILLKYVHNGYKEIK